MPTRDHINVVMIKEECIRKEEATMIDNSDSTERMLPRNSGVRSSRSLTRVYNCKQIAVERLAYLL
jgi:hypothetical protein